MSDEYKDVSREGLIDMLEEATERMTQAEARVNQGHICAYCGTGVGYSADAVLEHIQSCDKRPEKQIENMYRKRIALLVDAACNVIECHEADEDGTVWSGTKILALDVPNERKRDEAIMSLTRVLENPWIPAEGESFEGES